MGYWEEIHSRHHIFDPKMALNHLEIALVSAPSQIFSSHSRTEAHRNLCQLSFSGVSTWSYPICEKSGRRPDFSPAPLPPCPEVATISVSTKTTASAAPTATALRGSETPTLNGASLLCGVVDSARTVRLSLTSVELSGTCSTQQRTTLF